MMERYREQVKCIYIDPPYNTGGDGFPYKDGYIHSSWLAMLFDRVLAMLLLMSRESSFAVSIDDNEVHRLDLCLREVFGENKIGELCVIRAEGGGLAKQVVKGHDYLLLYARAIRTFPPLLRPKDIRGDIVEVKGRRYWIETDWLRKKFGKYGTLLYEDIERIKGKKKKEEIDQGLREGRYRLIKKGSGHIVGRLRSVDEDGSKFYSVVKHLNADGMNEVLALFPRGGFGYPKPLGLCEQYIRGSTFSRRYWDAVILDYFAGSGTTAHAVINLNREDGGNRKYILVEMAHYFDTVLMPRIKKVVYSKDWKDGQPTSPDTGISHAFKYIRIESYEDTLNNLKLKPKTKAQQKTFTYPEFKEDYMLGYWLDVETKDSPSLLDLKALENPFDYKMRIATKSVAESRPVKIDLIETFNWLLGLKVKYIYRKQGFFVVQGRNLKDESILIVWRNLKEHDNETLEKFLEKSGYNPRDTEFDKIYVNGDHTLEDPFNKVRVIDQEFRNLMFQE